MITYRPNHNKTLEGLVWFASQASDLDHYWAVKTLFFADYYHLNRYGRPVFGDTIQALEWGPVPSFALDMITRSSYASEDDLSASREAFDVVASATGQRLVARREPDLDLFSRTDLECLQEALEFCRPKSFRQLVDATHALPAYQQARETRGGRGAAIMDYALLLDESPRKREFLEHMRETATVSVF